MLFPNRTARYRATLPLIVGLFFAPCLLIGTGGCGPEENAAVSPARPEAAAFVTVPDLEGVTEDQARQVMGAKGLKLRVTTEHYPTVAAGHLAAQNPPPGIALAPGAMVSAVVSLGPEPARTVARPAPPAPAVVAAGSAPAGTSLEENGPQPEVATLPEQPPAVPPPPGFEKAAGRVAANDFLVCVDPGHPSETSAGANAHGLSENRLNWQVAVRLARRLNALGVACKLTKNTENQYVTNRQRAETANQAGAKLFIRLHCDVGGGRGYAWYYPDRAGTKYGVTGPPPAIQQASRRAAHVLNEAMKPVLRGSLQSNSIKTDAATFVGGKQGGVLTGSIFARVPTALIEMCFINQKNDARFIASEAGQEKMAEALAAGIVAYRDTTSQ